MENMNESSHSDLSSYETADEADEEIAFEENDRLKDIYRTYIDTNELRLENVKDAILLYNFIEKFHKTNIRNDFVNYIRTNLCVANIIEVYKATVELKQFELSKLCWGYIRDHTSEILEDESFITAEYNIVLAIISSDILALYSELEVYKAVLKWGKKHFKVDNPETFRELIFPLLKEVRFVSMTYVEFSGSPCIDGFLTKDEQLEIFRIKSNHIAKRERKSDIEWDWSNERLFNFLSSCYLSSECKNYLCRKKSKRDFLLIREHFSSEQDLKVWGASIQINVKLRRNNNTKLNANISLELQIYNLYSDEIKCKYDEISLRENKNFSETEKITIILDEPVIVRKQDIFRIEVRSFRTDTNIAEFIYCTYHDVAYNVFQTTYFDDDYDDDEKPNFAAVIASY